ncbi:hypothetical protein ABR965_18340 [Photorhabdus laumondii]|uniref:hypothetical protein n=1 Tax=Photorhabdus laumondii TaxID=2218628 RepID=UPI00331465AD
MPYLPEKAGMIYYAITSFTVRFKEETAVNILSYRLRTIYTRHLSSCLFVGCTHSPRLHRYLCSRGFVPLPSRSILKSIGYRLSGLLVDRAAGKKQGWHR